MFRKTFQHILFLTLFAVTTINAQILDSVLVVDSIKIMNSSGLKECYNPPLRYENGIKIVGEKTFDVEIKDGLLNLKDGTNVYSDEGKKKVIQQLKQLTGSAKPSNSDIRQIIYVNDEVKGIVAYLVLKHGIVFVAPEAPNKEQLGFASSQDGNEVFTHAGAIYTASNGSIIASTSTTLLVFTPTGGTNTSYEECFGKIPPLKHPSISGSSDPDVAFIRDITMTDGVNAVRLEFNMKTFKLRVGDDRIN